MKIIFRFALVIYLSVYAAKMSAQQSVTFDTEDVFGGEILSRSVGMNVCWLLDSDLKRPRINSNQQRFAEMNLGVLRFPYGHLADNYLWDTPPYGGSLTPQVATLGKVPGLWKWAVDTDTKSFKKAMDFDEFMEICEALNIKPLVVINVLSHKYDNGPDLQTLKDVAVEWVKYTKEKKYKVAYWQISNEIDHHDDMISQTEYVDAYIDFVREMKSVDPTIKCGPGILSKVSYFKEIVTRAPDLIDFTSAHQYLFNRKGRNYEEWLDFETNPGTYSNIKGMQEAVANSIKPDLPILITESNAYGNWDNKNPELYKGLAWFDLLFTEQTFKNVDYTFMWNTHSPWSGENGAGGVANALFNNDENNLTAMGWPVKILNTTAEPKMLKPDAKIKGLTYNYGTYNPDNGDATLYLMNKGRSPVEMDVTIANYGEIKEYERWVFTGKSPFDQNPKFERKGQITWEGNKLSTAIPPHSLVVLKLKETYYHLQHVGSEKYLQSTDDSTDVVPTAFPNVSNLTEWKLVKARNSDNYFIVSRANGKKLKALSNEINNPNNVLLESPDFKGQWVQWELTEADTSTYFLKNVGHNVKLNISQNQVSLGNIDWTGEWVQWRLIALGQTKSSLSIRENEVAKKKIIELYPNPVPTGQSFSIQYNNGQNFSETVIKIYTLAGQLLQTTIINEKDKKTSVSIHTGGFKEGLYIVKIKDDHGQSIKKILITSN